MKKLKELFIVTCKPQFYVNPKVPKKDIPSRSAVTLVNSNKKEISKFLDHYPKHHAETLPFNLLDSADFIN